MQTFLLLNECTGQYNQCKAQFSHCTVSTGGATAQQVAHIIKNIFI